MRQFLLAVLAATFMSLPAGAQTLDRIKETRTLQLGFRTDAAPMSYADADGNPAGYTPTVCVALAQAIANILEMDELNANFVPVDTTDQFDLVANGEIDLLCGATSITLRRREKVDFSDPVFVDGISFMVPLDTIKTIQDFNGKKIGVRVGTTTEETVANSFKAAEIAAETVAFSDHNAGLAALEKGEIDGYFADQSILYSLHFSSDSKANLRIAPEILTVEKQGLALARNDAEFRLLIDTALSMLYANGGMEEIFNETLPGVNPGLAMQALHLVAPTIP